VDQCCHGIWVEVRLGSVKVMVRVVDGRSVDFWGLWCPDVAEVGAVVVGRIGYVEVMMVGGEGHCYVVEGVVDDEECCCPVVAGWVGVRWMLHLIKRRFLHLFLLA
jgi:hypothetical protein